MHAAAVCARLAARPSMSNEPSLSAFRTVPRTGVIYVTTEAQPRGFRPGDPDWCNLGQGQPETGPLPGRAAARAARSRSTSTIRSTRPVAGLWELREAIAGLYNRALPARHAVAVHAPRTSASPAAGARRSRARRPAWATSTSGTSSPTTPRTKSCSTSSRPSPPSPSCSRASAATPSPSTICAARSTGRGLSALLLSNPCNPTGKLVAGRRAGALGARWRASSTARCCSTSSTRTTSGPAARGAAAGRERRALRRGRRPRSGRPLRRPHQELALPRLARHLDRRARGR